MVMRILLFLAALLGASALQASPAARALSVLADAAGDDVRGIVAADAAVPLLPLSAYWIGAGFRSWLGGDASVIVGRDPRMSSEALGAALCRGARGRDAGLATTPAMLEALLADPAAHAGSIMVTASHLPAQWNGFKFFSSALGRGLGRSEVAEVLAAAVALAADETGVKTRADPPLGGLMKAYAAKLRAAVSAAARDAGAAPLAGLSVCVNPGSGAGGFFAEKVLAPLGADVSSSINLEPDGAFPAHPANPADAAHVAATLEAVAAAGADVGVMLDTDADRCGLIDGLAGAAVAGSPLVALCAAVRSSRVQYSSGTPGTPRSVRRSRSKKTGRA